MMDLTTKRSVWGIILFGTLIGLNETLIGSLDIQYKSVVLSTVTLSLFAFARYSIPRPGSSLFIMIIAVLFKLTSMGPYLCKPAAVLLLGVGFESFASLFMRKDRFTYYSYILTSVLTSLIAFTLFALFETYIIKNEFWIAAKFNDYVFVKAPMTAVTTTLFTVSGLWLIRRPNLDFSKLMVKNPQLSQIILGLFIITIWIVGACSNPSSLTLEQRADQVSREEMESISELLGNDLFEGRAPGTRGGNLAEISLQSLFKFLNFEPGIDGSYFQPFVMKGFANDGFDFSANGIPLNYPEDVVGTFSIEEEEINLDGEAVFVGFGITTELWDWDDYKDMDVKDKIVVTRVNDPGMVNPEIFEGNTLTYFGRWTYHIEEASRRGAAGILLIHTDESAGYDWDVVWNSWSGEELYIESNLQNNLKFRGWMQESALRKILESTAFDLDSLYEASCSRDFTPADLGFSINITGKNHIRDVMNRNVVAEIPGKTEERIVLSAHIDHLGMDPEKEGDNIYNGAIDNGTAVGAMLITAKILKEFQEELHYTVTILACNAEESGLLGSRFYVENTDRSNIVANINFESTPVWGNANSIMGIGARFSGFEAMIKELAVNNGLEYSTFSMSNQGLFYRSDQFSFARYGIPAVWISAGEDEASGERNYTEFWKGNYHTVEDEFNPEWELEGMKQTIKYALLLVDHINKSKSPPKWKPDLPFPVEE